MLENPNRPISRDAAPKSKLRENIRLSKHVKPSIQSLNLDVTKLTIVASCRASLIPLSLPETWHDIYNHPGEWRSGPFGARDWHPRTPLWPSAAAPRNTAPLLAPTKSHQWTNNAVVIDGSGLLSEWCYIWGFAKKHHTAFTLSLRSVSVASLMWIIFSNWPVLEQKREIWCNQIKMFKTFDTLALLM